MATIRIRVMAIADTSMTKVFASLPASAAKARAAVNGELGKMVSDAKKSGDSIYRTAASGEEKVTAVVSREADKQARARQRGLDRARSAGERFLADQQRNEEKATREAERQSKRRQEAFVSAAREFGGRVSSNIGRVGSVALGTASAIAGGMGVDMSVQGQIAKAVSTNRSLIDATNSGFTAKGKMASVGDVGATQKAVEAAGDATKISYADMAEGLKTYVGLTGELDEGKNMLKSLGDIAQATGSKVEDVAGAAGAMSKALGNAPDKAERLSELLRVLASQGDKGSVVFRNLASQMPKISGTAFQYAGKGFSREQAIGQLGALGQFSISGGSTNAAQAATAVQSFSTGLLKSASIKNFAAAGIDVFSDKEHKQLKSPEQIILESLQKTGGSEDALAKLFSNSRASTITKGLSSTFNEAGGGQAGLDAVKDLFEDMSKPMTDAMVKNAAELAENSPGAKAEELNNAMQKVADKMLTDIMPAFDKMEPDIEKLAGAFGDLVGWAAKNPGEAIVVAITGSIAKAGLETALKSGIESMLKGAGSSGASTQLGQFSNGLGRATAAVGAFFVGWEAGKQVVDEAAKGVNDSDADIFKHKATVSNLMEEGAVGTFASQSVKDAEIQKALNEQKALQDKIDATESGPGMGATAIGALTGVGATSALANWLTGGSVGSSISQQASQANSANNLDELKAELQNVTRAVADLRNRPINVNVTTPQGAPPVDQSGRTGDTAH